MTGRWRRVGRTMPIALAAAVGLVACGLTPEGEFARAAVRSKGHEVIQEGLANLEWMLCRATPVGAIIARYGDSQARMDAWWTLCQGQRDVRFPVGEDEPAAGGGAG